MECKTYVYERVRRLQKNMEQAGLDVVVLQKPENVFYFSHFNPVINSHPALAVIPAQGPSCLLVHSLRADHAKEEGVAERLEFYGTWGRYIPVALNPADAVREILGKGVKKIGLELDCISVGFAKELEKTLESEETVSVSEMINRMKMIKDAYEIECIRRSALLVDIGVEATIEAIRQGYSEAEASTEGQYAMRQMWHRRFRETEVCGFGTSEGGMIDSLNVWCLSNGHIAYGCDCPRHYQPKEGDLTLPMAWAKTGGYHAENERTVIIGKLDAFRRNAYDGMLEARERVFKILRPGIRFCDLYEAAAEIYSRRGFESILPGRIGHGVGCSAHEFPSVSKNNFMPLEPGMVITVEPGLMEQSWGGVRHSDTVLITEQGFEFLTKYDRGEITVRIH